MIKHVTRMKSEQFENETRDRCSSDNRVLRCHFSRVLEMLVRCRRYAVQFLDLILILVTRHATRAVTRLIRCICGWRSHFSTIVSSRYRGDTSGYSSRNREIGPVFLVQKGRLLGQDSARRAKPCRARSDIEFDLHRWPSYVHETRRCVVARLRRYDCVQSNRVTCDARHIFSNLK